jgi:hypothetical protein
MEATRLTALVWLTACIASVALGVFPARSANSTLKPEAHTIFADASPALADHFDKLAASPMAAGRPTAAAAAELKDELLFQRATQVYLWALPLINTLGMKEGSEKVFGA